MTVEQAELLVMGIGLYAAIGAVFSLLFVTALAPRLDPAAKGMPVQARALVFWGVAGLWPLFLVKTILGSKPA
jgi:hypothetical protein